MKDFSAIPQLDGFMSNEESTEEEEEEEEGEVRGRGGRTGRARGRPVSRSWCRTRNEQREGREGEESDCTKGEGREGEESGCPKRQGKGQRQREGPGWDTGEGGGRAAVTCQ